MISKFPLVQRIVHKERIKRNFRTEIRLINKRPISTTSKPSCLHFSVNKSATQYVKSLLVKLANENGLIPVHLHEYSFVSSLPYYDHLTAEEMALYAHLFRPQGFMYTVFGGFIEGIPNFSDYNIVVTIRDPRDILVSTYYSTAFSHVLPPDSGNKREAFIKARESALTKSIDEFVLEEVAELKDVFERYWKHLAKANGRVTFLKYEEMLEDFEGWLDKLAESCECTMSPQLREKFLSDFKSKRGKKENIYDHHRKGVAGDYLEKLKPETIEALNLELQAVLRNFGYGL